MKKRVSLLFTIILMIGISIVSADGILPDINEVYGFYMPNISNAIGRMPDIINNEQDGITVYVYEKFLPEEYNTFSTYLSNNGCSVSGYQVEGSKISISLEKGGYFIQLIYDKENQFAEMRYPKPTCPEKYEEADADNNPEITVVGTVNAVSASTITINKENDKDQYVFTWDYETEIIGAIVSRGTDVKVTYQGELNKTPYAISLEIIKKAPVLGNLIGKVTEIGDGFIKVKKSDGREYSFITDNKTEINGSTLLRSANVAVYYYKYEDGTAYTYKIYVYEPDFSGTPVIGTISGPTIYSGIVIDYSDSGMTIMTSDGEECKFLLDDIVQYTGDKLTSGKKVYVYRDSLFVTDIAIFKERSSDISMNAGETVSEIEIETSWEIISFGSFEQDNNIDNGKEPIEWILLDQKGNEALLISKYALCASMYTDSYVQDRNGNRRAVWPSSKIRKWLNEDFVMEAFSDKEREAIRITTIDSSKESEKYKTKIKNTEDRVFLLSYEEAWKFFDSNESRVCFPTQSAIAQGIKMEQEGTCRWWLRTPGVPPKTECIVTYKGTYFNSFDSSSNEGIRPAMWVDLSQISI